MEAFPLRQFLLHSQPRLPPSAFVAPGAVVVGAVTLGELASIWYGCVLRGDINSIHVGAESNVQDGSVLHVSDDFPCVLGERVSVGHRAIVHAAEVGDETLVGMGAIVLDGARIGPRCLIGAGALITRHAIIPEGSLVLGSPGRVVRALSEAERHANVMLAHKYVELSRRYLNRFGPGQPDAAR